MEKGTGVRPAEALVALRDALDDRHVGKRVSATKREESIVRPPRYATLIGQPSWETYPRERGRTRTQNPGDPEATGPVTRETYFAVEGEM